MVTLEQNVSSNTTEIGKVKDLVVTLEQNVSDLSGNVDILGEKVEQGTVINVKPSDSVIVPSVYFTFDTYVNDTVNSLGKKTVTWQVVSLGDKLFVTPTTVLTFPFSTSASAVNVMIFRASVDSINEVLSKHNVELDMDVVPSVFMINGRVFTSDKALCCGYKYYENYSKNLMLEIVIFSPNTLNLSSNSCEIYVNERKLCIAVKNK